MIEKDFTKALEGTIARNGASFVEDWTFSAKAESVVLANRFVIVV